MPLHSNDDDLPVRLAGALRFERSYCLSNMPLAVTKWNYYCSGGDMRPLPLVPLAYSATEKGLSLAAAVVFALTFNWAHAAPLLTEHQARAKAIDILRGDPYGRTPVEVSKNIKQVQFVRDGNTRACGAKKSPAWEFHVVVVTANRDQFNNGVIDGYLALDARTGRILCANLPLLD